MSLILEAMQKKEGADGIPVRPRTGYLWLWRMACVALVGVVGVWWWMASPVKPSEENRGLERSLSRANQQAVVPPVPQRRVRPDTPKDGQGVAGSDKASELTPEPTHPVNLPPLDWLKQKMKRFRYQSHVYSPDVTHAFVVINGQMLSVGDAIVPGAKIRQITAQALVIDTPVGPAKLTALRGW